MTGAKVRFILSGILVASWVLYLVYLAWTNARPSFRFDRGPEFTKTPNELLSRSQFLAADADIVAEVDENGVVDPDSVDVLWGDDNLKIGELSVKLTQEFRVNPDRVDPKRSSQPEWSEFKNAGRYIIPLKKEGDNWRPASLPISPGYPISYTRSHSFPAGRVYHDNTRTREQQRAIRKKY